MTRKVTDTIGKVPKRYKEYKRFHIGFTVREACNTSPNSAHGRTRSKSITVSAETLSEAINEKNLRALLAIVRAEFLTRDARTKRNPAPRVPRAHVPPKATPYRVLLALKKEKELAQRQHELQQQQLLEEALIATAAIREETNGHFNDNRVRDVAPAAVNRRTPPAKAPELPVAARNAVNATRAPRPATRVAGTTRGAAPAPRPVAPRPYAPPSAVATARKHTALSRPVLHEHTHWCLHPDTAPRAPRPPINNQPVRRPDNRPGANGPVHRQPRPGGQPAAPRDVIDDLMDDFKLPPIIFEDEELELE